MRGSHRVLLAALLVLAALLRFGALNRVEIWLDEAQSLTNVTGTVNKAVQDLGESNKPPLYYLLLWPWIGTFGPSVAALRSFSALCGVLAVAVIWWIGPPMLAGNVARVAALLLALHPLAIHYSREGRNYSLFILLACLTILALPRAIESGRRRWWAGWAASCGACVMTHYIGVLLLPISVLQVALARRRDILVPWLVSSVLAMVPLVLWLPFVSQQREFAVSSLSWFHPYWHSWSPFEPFIRSLVMLTPGGAAPPWVGLPSSEALQPLVVLTGLSALSSYLLQKDVDGPSHRARYVIPAALVLPLLVLWIASRVTFPVYVIGRADLVALPGAVLLIAVGTVAARNRAVAFTVGALVGVSTILGLVTYFTMTPPDQERPVLETLAKELGPADVIVTTGLTRPTAEYYLRLAPTPARLASWPDGMAAHPAFFDPREWPREVLDADADAIDGTIRETLRMGGRVVLLLSADEWTPRLLAKLTPRYRITVRSQYRLRRVGSEIHVACVSALGAGSAATSSGSSAVCETGV